MTGPNTDHIKIIDGETSSNLPQSGQHRGINALNFNQFKEEFLNELGRKDRSKNTLKNYRTDLDCFSEYLENQCGHFGLLGFDLDAVLEYGKFLQKKYTSDNSRRRRVQTLRIFFDSLVSKGLFPDNPVRKIPTSPKFLDIPRPASFSEIKTLWHCLMEEASDPNPMSALMAKRNQVIFLLIYGAGLKVSDLSEMNREDLILTGNDIRVLVRPWRRDPYSVPLPINFKSIYESYLQALAPMKVLSQVEFPSLLFNANPYKILRGGLSPRGLEIVMEEYRSRLLIQMTPKSLRQATVMKWINQGHADSLIKEWLGVAPSYDLAQYKMRASQFCYDDNTLFDIYSEYVSQ
ncbi:MAG: phage integrase SAM-like domain-containing protein [Bdellovibrio sp.]|nr:phage integrase SAM-like domain-containing protein [Bdellovibrio sp.]